jgi:hypothetical protein
MKTSLINEAEIVLDECVPEPLYRLFDDFKYFSILGSVFESIVNGELISLCDRNKVKYLVTSDKKMEKQQIKRISNYSLIIVILNAKYNTELDLQSYVENFIRLYPIFKTIFVESSIYRIDKNKIRKAYIREVTNKGQIKISYMEVLKILIIY